MFSDRRVHRLKLRAANPDLIQHGAVVVEDALRTASLPGLPQNGVLLIRRLNLGRLAAGATSASVAGCIESMLRNLRISVVGRDSAEQPRAGVVWFHDEVAPYTILADLLARRIQPQSWYWPRAVRGWSVRMTMAQGLRHVLHEVSRTRAGIAGAARVVEALISGSGLETLGRSLQPGDGHTLLASGGVGMPIDVDAAGGQAGASLPPVHLDRPWRRAFEALLPQWGRRDARTAWLAHVAVCARCGMTNPHVAAGLLREVYQMQASRAVTALRRPHRLPPPEMSPAGNVKPSAALPEDGGESDGHTRLRPAAKRQRPLAGRVSRAADHSDPAQNHPAAGALRSEQTIRHDQRDRIRPEVMTPDDEPGRGSRFGRPLKAASAADDNHRTKPADPEAAEKAQSLKRSAPAATDFTAGRFQQRSRGGPQLSEAFRYIDLAGAESEYAGLVFAVQALEWLGIRDSLAAHPLLAACRLPARILWHCVDRLAIPHNDPICKFLADLPAVPAGASFTFVAPAVWQNYCRPSGPAEKALIVRRVRGVPGKRLLTDKSTGLIVALWQGPVPPAARSWVRQRTLQRRPASPPFNDLNRIISAWVAAMDFFLRRYARTDLRRMAMRAGRVAATRTHLDITFDLNRLDIGIRQAGLDIDPGWVPWLGRVVYIHYRGREEIINV